jgi:putative ABC transport system ATP-binding protein
MNNLIDIKNLQKRYDNGAITALNGIDLQIKEGEFVSIMGPSGSGKSTLLNMIGALDRADSGNINVAGIDLMENTDLSDFRSQEIGFVFQLHNLIPNLSVIENVEIPMFESKLSSEQMRKRAMELLESVELLEKINQKPTKLSGGERQRVAIARALLVMVTHEPSVAEMADRIINVLDGKIASDKMT